MNVWTLKTVQDRCKEDGLCWIWRQGVSSEGLPMATIEGKGGRLVGRFVYTRLMGQPVTAKFAVVAKCGNRLCVSPDCLVKRYRGLIQSAIWKTGMLSRHEDYVEHALGVSRNPGCPAKLDFEKARQIRARRSEKASALAAEFGVRQDAITRIWRGRTWREPKQSANASVFTWAQGEAA